MRIFLFRSSSHSFSDWMHIAFPSTKCLTGCRFVNFVWISSASSQMFHDIHTRTVVMGPEITGLIRMPCEIPEAKFNAVSRPSTRNAFCQRRRRREKESEVRDWSFRSREQSDPSFFEWVEHLIFPYPTVLFFSFPLFLSVYEEWVNFISWTIVRRPFFSLTLFLCVSRLKLVHGRVAWKRLMVSSFSPSLLLSVHWWNDSSDRFSFPPQLISLLPDPDTHRELYVQRRAVFSGSATAVLYYAACERI